MEMFFRHFPDVAVKEMKGIVVRAKWDGVPAGTYGFLEGYCTDPECDCRRVLLHVVHEPEGIVATISFGFDPDGEMPGPFLDPLHPQPAYGAGLLRLVGSALQTDRALVASFERHYQMIKQKVGKPAKPTHEWKKPKKPKKPRRWGER